MISDILHKYNINFQISGKELITLCPFHMDRKPSCYIHNLNGLFYCFSCHASGGIQKFIEKATGEKLKKDEIFTLEDELTSNIEQIYEESCGKMTENEDFYDFLAVLSNEKQNFVPFHENNDAVAFLEKKKTDLTLCEQYFFQYAVRGRYEGRIIFPLFNGKDEIGFHSRDIKGHTDRKYVFNVHKGKFKNFIYNLHNVVGKTIILVEGIFDVLGLISRGYKNVASTLSTTVKDDHILQLSRFKNIIFCFDPDYAGEEAVKKAAVRIMELFPTKSIYLVELPCGKDPDEITQEECDSMFRKIRRIKSKQESQISLEINF